MGEHGHKQIFERFQREVISAGHYEVADELVAHELVSHNPLPGQAPGVEGLKDTLRRLRLAFPDLKTTTHMLIADGDIVAGRFSVQGTHRGEFMGIQATGKEIAYEEMIFVRIAAGKIVEHWSVADVMQMMLDLGAVAYKK
jgi:predicted ester cyclase